MEKEGLPGIKQEEIHNLLFTRDLGWQEIIYDLINTEQLDPWNIDIIILSDRYLSKIEQLEEADFFVSSKVLLAAALLLRIKSEILLNKYIKSIDEVLFGNEEKKSTPLERIELDEDVPELVPRSPMPRFKKVTLNELMEALNKAIVTENRRIKKEIVNRNALRETGISLPRKKKSIKHQIKQVHENIHLYFKKNKEHKSVPFTKLVGENKKERIEAFYPLLHLENTKKVWLHQETHFEEIHVWLKDVYFEHNPDPYAELREGFEEDKGEI
jgi:segregation and condensation protein A